MKHSYTQASRASSAVIK